MTIAHYQETLFLENPDNPKHLVLGKHDGLKIVNIQDDAHDHVDPVRVEHGAEGKHWFREDS